MKSPKRTLLIGILIMVYVSLYLSILWILGLLTNPKILAVTSALTSAIAMVLVFLLED